MSTANGAAMKNRKRMQPSQKTRASADYESVLSGAVITSGAIAKQRAAVHRLQLMAPAPICEMASNAVESAKVLSRALRDGAPTDGLQPEYAWSMTMLSYAMKLDLHGTDRQTRKEYRKFLSEMPNIRQTDYEMTVEDRHRRSLPFREAAALSFTLTAQSGLT